MNARQRNARVRRPGRRQHGGILIMYCFMLVLILGFFGLALDLGLVYLRKVQLQSAADAIALAAAQRLDGTATGVAAAVSAATTNAYTHRIGLARLLDATTWNPAALQFSSTPEGTDGWRSAADAAATPATMWYARVDMAELDDAQHLIQPVFLGAVGVTGAIDVGARAVAGAGRIRITPLAVCAMGAATATRTYGVGASAPKETVTYGFRTGVTYNLLKLNPQAGSTKGAFFLLDPLVPPGLVAGADTSTQAAAAPFMCNGTLAYGNVVTGAAATPLNVRRLDTFTMADHLNSRLASTTACTSNGAPLDTNVTSYRTPTWQATPTRTSAAPSSGTGLPLATVADLPVGQTSTAADYGTRWAFAQPRNTTSNSLFATSTWSTLYPTLPAAANPTGWPSATPYVSGQPGVPAATSRKERRVMAIALLDCGSAPPAVGLATARVLALGRFLLSASATDGDGTLASASEVPAEFGGLLSAAQLAQLRTAELYQ